MGKQKHFYLIRGLVREADHWGPFPDFLREHNPHCKITTLDLPGAGELLNEKVPLSVEGMVDKMHQHYQVAQSDEIENHVVAVSLGAMIAVSWMKKKLQDFHKAYFINTSFKDLSPFYHRMRPLAFFHLARTLFITGRKKEEHILRLVTNSPIKKELLDLWEQIAKQRPVTSESTVRQLLAASQFRIGEWKPSIPLYLISSTKDRMVSIECSRRAAGLWNAPLVEHPTAGHELVDEDPQWTADRIWELGTR
jgi:pimeloyl-ACP methyl ester carboxylesterase